jgi:hypothetical protein
MRQRDKALGRLSAEGRSVRTSVVHETTGQSTRTSVSRRSFKAQLELGNEGPGKVRGGLSAVEMPPCNCQGLTVTFGHWSRKEGTMELKLAAIGKKVQRRRGRAHLMPKQLLACSTR